MADEKLSVMSQNPENTPSHTINPSKRGRFLSPLFIVIIILFGLSLFEVITLSQPMFRSALHGNDFKHLWAGTRALQDGLSPYEPKVLFWIADRAGLGSINPYVYLPSTALFLISCFSLRFSGQPISLVLV